MSAVIPSPMHIVIPLAINVLPSPWTAAQVARETWQRQEAVLKWLDWHWGSATAYALKGRVRVTLTLLTPQVVEEGTQLQSLLSPVSEGVWLWLTYRVGAATTHITCHYTQRQEPRRAPAVDLLLDPHPDSQG